MDKFLIRDLLSLTKALYDISDNLAWYALLRSPLCGLELKDLSVIKNASKYQVLLSALIKFESLALSESAKIILRRVMPIIKHNWFHREDHDLNYLVEATWIALGGELLLKNQADNANVQQFFSMLWQFDKNNSKKDFNEFESLLSSTKSESSVPEGNYIDIMTIHKSKGLEFDTIIMPGLHRTTQRDQGRLLVWQEIADKNDNTRLLLAPMKSEKHDSIYDYITHLENIKAQNELLRLLYVATTRAKRNLHLIFKVEPDEKQSGNLQTPKNGSLLEKLWPFVSKEINVPIKNSLIVAKHKQQTKTISQKLYRINPNWHQLLYDSQEAEKQKCNNSYSTNRHIAAIQIEPQRTLGSIIHKLIEISLKKSPDFWNKLKDNSKTQFIQKIISTFPCNQSEQPETVDICINALRNFYNSDLRNILLKHTYFSEYKLSFVDAHKKIRNVIIDLLVEFENEIWIIDFKTANHLSDTSDNFFDKQKKLYQNQLSLYETAVKSISNKTTHKVLYFILAGKMFKI